MPKFAVNDDSPAPPLLEPDVGSAFRCPGESAPISAAIHYARLKSGWTACTECIWNSHKPTSQVQSNQSMQVRKQAGNEIRRTAFGIRGAYLNAIDRFRAAQLAAIFATHLANLKQAETEDQPDAPKQQFARSDRIRIAIGYDGRMGSADIFAGVVSAVLQNGGDVLDLGRCTANSLLAGNRLIHGIAGCLLVTGSGRPSGEVGIDIFGDNEQSVAIPWHEFGVGIRVSTKEAASAGSQSTQSQIAEKAHSAATFRPHAADVWEHLHQMRHPTPTTQSDKNRTQPNISDASTTHIDTTDIEATLILPTMGQSRQLFRTGRTSGELATFASETAYLDWLRRWWPRSTATPVRFRVADELVSQRLTLLANEFSIPLLLRKIGDVTDDKDNSGRLPLSFEIAEDDRFVTVYSRRGRQLPPDELATWINKATRKSSSHVTAHRSLDGKRLLLVDIASPSSGRSHEVISDGLAIAGFLLTLISNSRNQLPT